MFTIKVIKMMKFNYQRRSVIFSSLLALTSVSACEGNDPGNSAIEVTVTAVEDLGVVDQGENIRGRDGGYSGVHNDRSVWVFGDSVTETANADGQNWFSSSWATSVDIDASDGIGPLELGMHSASGEPVELLTYTNEEQQFNDLHKDGPECVDPCGARWALWPGPIVADPVRNRSLLFYQKISAQVGELNFFGVGRSIAVWPNDAMRPTRPVIDETATHPTLMPFPTNLQPGNAALIENDYLYAFGCDRDRNDVVCSLGRVSLEHALEVDQWEYATGTNRWSKDASQGTELFFGADIMSVTFNAHLGRYIAVYSEPTSRDIKLRSASSIDGPWSAPTHLVTAMASANTNGWVYDGLTHPQFNEQDGHIIYLTYTRDPGTEWFAREMRLVRVSLDLL